MMLDRAFAILAVLLILGCGGGNDAGPTNVNPYANNGLSQGGGTAPASSQRPRQQPVRPANGAPSRSGSQSVPQVIEVPQADYAAEMGVPLSFVEYVRFARRSSELLGEMTMIHAAVSEAGDARAHQQSWGDLTAEHTALARDVVAEAHPPADLARELARNALPRLRSELEHAQDVMQEFDDLEGGLAQPYAQAETIFKHLTKNLTSAEVASLSTSPANLTQNTDSAPGTSTRSPASSSFSGNTATVEAGSNSDSQPGPSSSSSASRRTAPAGRNSSGPWRVSVDPPEETLSLTEDARLGIKIPGPRSAGDAGIHYPLTPSPYVLLGTNSQANQSSEVWDLQSRRKIETIKGLALGSSVRMALRGDGRYFAAQPVHEGLIGVWDTEASKPLGALPIKEWSGVEFIGFGVRDRLVIVDGDDLVIATLPDLREQRRVTLPSWRSATSHALSPGGRFLAFHAEDDVRIYDLTIAQEVGTLPMDKAVKGIAFSDDGNKLAALYDDHFDECGIAIWNAANGKQTSEIVFEEGLDDLIEPNSSYRGRQLEWFPGGKLLLMAGCGIVDRQAGSLLMILPAKVAYPVAPIGPRQLGVAKGNEFDAYVITDDQVANARAVAAAGGEAIDTVLPPLRATDRSSVESVVVQPGGGSDWSVSPERLAGQNLQTKPQSSISIPSGQIYRGALSAPESQRIALIYSGVPIRTRSSSGWGLAPTRTPVRIDWYDTRRSKKLSSYELPFTSTLESLSPGGTLALTRIADGMDRLDVWNLEEKQHVCGFRPYNHLGEDSRDRDIVAAAFVDEEHILTRNSKSLTLYQIATGKAIYEINLEGLGRAVVSPSRAFLALLDERHHACQIFEALTGRQVGTVQCGSAPSGCGFHPSGKQLAVLIGNQTGGEVLVVDMLNGQVTEKFPVPRSGALVQWMGDQHLLVGGEWRYRQNAYLIDVSRRMVVWNYGLRFGMHLWDSADGRHWYLSATDRNARSFSVNALALPEPDVADFLEEHAQTPELVLEPGGGIDVLVSVQDPPGESDFADRVRQNIVARYSNAGINIVQGHSLIMSITGSSGSTGRTMKFGRIAGGFDSETVDVSEQEVRWDITITQNGETIWDNTLRYSNGGVIWMPDDSDVSSEAGDQMWAQAAAGLLNYNPPVYVFPADARDGLGASQLTPRGPVTQFRTPSDN